MKAVVFLIVAAVVAGVAVHFYQQHQAGQKPPVVTGPGPSDRVLAPDWTVESACHVFYARGGDRADLESALLRAWTPAEPAAWELTIETANDTSAAAVFTTSGIGGGHRVILMLGHGHDVQPAQRVRVQGYIAEIETLYLAGVPDHRLILDPVVVLTGK
jgi:hypothetical protein